MSKLNTLRFLSGRRYADGFEFKSRSGFYVYAVQVQENGNMQFVTIEHFKMVMRNYPDLMSRMLL